MINNLSIKRYGLGLGLLAMFLGGCGSDSGGSMPASPESSRESSSSSTSESSSSSSLGQSSSSAASTEFYRGVDLSYVNEMEDCGAVYTENGEEKDPYLIFVDQGANLVRLRLWHTPDWQTSSPEEDINTYSTLEDVKVAIRRAKAQGLPVLLDFHYSDTWADPGRQDIPAAWSDRVDDTEALAEAVHQYTYDTLMELDAEGLMPELVQVGNETNGSVMMTPGEELFPIDWTRNSTLLNAGIQGVREAGAQAGIDPEIMLHIAEPENIEWWFSEAVANGITGFDFIGISYYPAWSNYSIADVAELVERLRAAFEREIMIVETGVSWTENGTDDGADLRQRPAGVTELTPEVQAQWLIELAEEVYQHGGAGVVYWEPAWVSTDCYNRWDQGSHWELNTFFDFDHNLINNGGVRFLGHDYVVHQDEIEAVFEVTLDDAEHAYIAGDMTEGERVAMESVGDGVFRWSSALPAHSFGQYRFYSADADSEVETVPEACRALSGDGRSYHLTTSSREFRFPFGACTSEPEVELVFRVDMNEQAEGSEAFIVGDFPGEYEWLIVPMEPIGDARFEWSVTLSPETGGAYYFLLGDDWDDREVVPAECADMYDSDRRYDAPTGEGGSFTYGYEYGTCTAF